MEASEVVPDTAAVRAEDTGTRLRWELEQVMARVRPADLSASEVAALLIVLRPAHSRVIGRPAGRPGLRVVGVDDGDPTP